MIKAVIERHVKKGTDISLLLAELRTAALASYGGYLGGETLISTEDSSDVIVISTWQSVKDWEEWAGSEIRAMIYERIAPLLKGEPRAKTYQLVATN